MTTGGPDDGQDAPTLFGPEELEVSWRPGQPGRAERLLIRALTAAARCGTIVEEDLGLVGSALNGARALDTAERGGAKGGPYATAALLTPYRETLQALRIPAAVEPEGGPRPPSPGTGEMPEWLNGAFGTAE